jgi:hypothetical protein
MREIPGWTHEAGNRYRCNDCGHPFRIDETDPLPVLCHCGGRARSTSSPRLAWNYAAALARHVASGLPMLTAEEIEGRLSICRPCSQFDGSACRLCGCNCNGKRTWRNKLALPLERCPDNTPRW